MERPMKHKPKKTAKAPSQRMLRVAEIVRHKLAEMLVRGEIHDDVLSRHVVTIPEVRISPDLKLATVYVMPLGGKDADMKEVLVAFDRAKKFIRGEVARTLDLRYAPDLRFRSDDSFETSLKIDRLLNSAEVKRDLVKKPEPAIEPAAE
jgi:ribosome-binding factor A